MLHKRKRDLQRELETLRAGNDDDCDEEKPLMGSQPNVKERTRVDDHSYYLGNETDFL